MEKKTKITIKSNRKNEDKQGPLLIGTINIQQQITLLMLYDNNRFCPTPIGGGGTKSSK